MTIMKLLKKISSNDEYVKEHYPQIGRKNTGKRYILGKSCNASREL